MIQNLESVDLVHTRCPTNAVIEFEGVGRLTFDKSTTILEGAMEILSRKIGVAIIVDDMQARAKQFKLLKLDRKKRYIKVCRVKQS